MRTREWTDGDGPAVDALLDPEPDRLWAGQGHRLHGPPREGERWKRTWVGEQGDAVVGAITLGRNYVHPARYSCAVEVAPASRRNGLGRQLIEFARDHRAEPLPLAVKVRERDAAGRALSATFDSRLVARSPCPVVRPADAVPAWCAAHAGPARPMTGSDPHELVVAFSDLYRWQHEDWSPVRSEPALAEMSGAVLSELDHDLSAGVWRGDRLVAASFVFREAARLECVAETTRRDEPDGVELLAAAIAATLTAAEAAGIDSVEFDGHDADPHLAPLVATLPIASSNPLLLVELP
jgi:GNAT superfamily N-acetyltransferase